MVITSTTGNRVAVKSGPRVRIPPTPPHGSKRHTACLLYTSFGSGVCGFLVQAMTDYSFYNYRVMFLFWAYLAVGALCARRSQLPEGRLWV